MEATLHRVLVSEAAELPAATENGVPKRRVDVTLVSVGPGNNTTKAYYTQDAINSGPPVFMGARCFQNHASKLQATIQPERTIEELCGYFTNVRVEGEKLKATLNILDGDEFNDLWNKIKAAIAYSKQNPGRVIMGLSISAGGDVKPMVYQGAKWSAVQRFTDVKSVDIVTWPARGGEFNAVLSESEVFTRMFEQSESVPSDWKGTTHAMLDHPEIDNPYALTNWMANKGWHSHIPQAEAGEIYQTLKDHVGGLKKSGAPGAEDTGRIIDKLGTALKFNKQEDNGNMDPNTTQPTAQPGDDFMGSEAFKGALKQHAESYKKQAETEADPMKKAHFGKMAEAFGKMSEGGINIAHNHAPINPAAPPATAPPNQSEEEAAKIKAAAEAEAKRQAENGGGPAKLPGGASESERVFEGKYLEMLKTQLLDKSGLPETTKNLLKMTFLETERDEKKIKSIVDSYTKAYLEESKRQHGHGSPRKEGAPEVAGTKNNLTANRPGLKRLLAGVRKD